MEKLIEDFQIPDKKIETWKFTDLKKVQEKNNFRPSVKSDSTPTNPYKINLDISNPSLHDFERSLILFFLKIIFIFLFFLFRFINIFFEPSVDESSTIIISYLYFFKDDLILETNNEILFFSLKIGIIIENFIYLILFF